MLHTQPNGCSGKDSLKQNGIVFGQNDLKNGNVKLKGSWNKMTVKLILCGGCVAD